MFEGGDPINGATTQADALSPASLQSLVDRLAVGQPDDDPKVAFEQLRLIVAAQSALAAAQARVTNSFVGMRKGEQVARGFGDDRVGRGIGNEVSAATGMSPSRARRYMGFTRILTTELVETFAALERGETSEWRCMLVARETAWLSSEHRAEVDAQVGPKLGGWSDRQAEAETRRRAITLDPEGMLARLAKAEKDRRVSIPPAPDLMAWIRALVPMKQGVAAYAALKAAADTIAGTADGRSHAQIMADTLIERVTGQAVADEVPVTVDVIMGAGTFFNAGDDKDAPGTMDGYGPIPADVARDIAWGRPGSKAPRWIRRLYTRPDSGQLLTMETRRRLFSQAQREFLRLRDQACRMPYCDAPIRHADHVKRSADGGPTSLDNGEGLCVACNKAKEAPGWTITVHANGDIEAETPTGHRYRSRAPDLTRPSDSSPPKAVPDAA